MMLDLKIQSAYKPGNELIFCSKIGCSFYLVNSPLIFHFAGFQVSYRKRCMFNGMCKLENKTQYETCHQREDEKTNKPRFKPHHINRQADKQKEMNQFETPENKMIAQLHFFNRRGSNSAFKIFLIIQQKYPKDVEHGIKYPEINVLVLM